LQETTFSEAVQLSETSPDSEKATYLNGLALTLIAKYRRHGKLDYLRESIEKARTAPGLEHNIADRAKYLGCLASGQCLLYERTKEEGTLSEALESAEMARETTIKTAHHPYRLTCASILARIHTQRFELLRETESFDEALRLFSEASNSWSEDDPSRAVASMNLGNLYYYPSEHRDLDKALEYFLHACKSTTIHTTLRVKASQIAIGIMEDKGLYAEAIKIGDSVLHMLPDLCDRSMNLSDQQHAVQQVAGLAAEICSLYLQEGQVCQGLQKLEFGRGVILRYMFDKHDGVEALEQDYPALA
jgi:tetratricopeptide (TPR) repeat protein